MHPRSWLVRMNVPLQLFYIDWPSSSRSVGCHSFVGQVLQQILRFRSRKQLGPALVWLQCGQQKLCISVLFLLREFGDSLESFL